MIHDKFKNGFDETANGVHMYQGGLRRHGIFDNRETAISAYWLTDDDLDILQNKADVTEKMVITQEMVSEFKQAKIVNG